MILIEYLFNDGQGYEQLKELINSNPRFVFKIMQEDSRDRRTIESRKNGWMKIQHRRHGAYIKTFKKNGCCYSEIKDESGGYQLTGSWISWLAANASEIVNGVDVRFE